MRVYKFPVVWGVAALVLSAGTALIGNEAEERRSVAEPVSIPELRVMVIRSADLDQCPALPDHASGLVVISDLPLLDEPAFRRTARGYLGRPFSDRGLGELVGEIEKAYRANRRPVVEVDVIRADQERGLLELKVREARIRQVQVSGSRWFRRTIFTGKSRLRAGDRIDSGMVNEDLDWMNRNPFRVVDARFEPTDEPGEVDLVFEVKDRFPFRIYGGFENTGNTILGEERFIAGFNWGHLLALDHELHYEFGAGRYLDRIMTHSAAYVAPLPSRHEFKLYGHYSDVDLDAPEIEGENLEIGARYTIFMVGWDNPDRGLRLSQEVFFGADFKRAETAVEYGSAEFFSPATEIIQGVGGYRGIFRDPLGQTELEAAVFYSPGNFLSERNRDAVFDEARPEAPTRYAYTRIGLERETYLDDGFSLFTRGAYQYADSRLLRSEQLGVGGYTSVRGYEERAAVGDSGYLLSAELRTPEFNWNRLFGVGRAGRDRWQLLGFVDYGMARTKDPVGDEFKRVHLMGAGPGLRVRIDDNFALRFDYGWQVRTDVPENDSRDHRAHAAVVLSY